MPAARAWNPKAVLAGGILCACIGTLWLGTTAARLLGGGSLSLPAQAAYAAAPVRLVARQEVTLESTAVALDSAPLCKGKTRRGEPCRRRTRDASGYCKDHRNQDPKAPKPKEPSQLPK